MEVAAEILSHAVDLSQGHLLVLIKQRVKAFLLESFPASRCIQSIKIRHLIMVCIKKVKRK